MQQRIGTEMPGSEWTRFVEFVLRGIAHSLNNRAAAINAVMELAGDPDDDVASTVSILRTELEKVSELSSVARAIGAPRTSEDAFLSSDALRHARSVLSMHSELREREIVIDVSSRQPMRGPEAAYFRATMLLAAGTTNGAASPELRISVRDESSTVTTVVAGTADARVSPAIVEMVRALGGEPLSGAYGFSVPTLESIRPRESR